MARYKRITPKIAKFINENYLKMSKSDIAEKFKISRSSLANFMNKNDLKVPDELWKKWKKEKRLRPITKKEIEYIHQNIKNQSIKEIVKNLNRSPKLIKEAVDKLGYRDFVMQRMKNARFKKGHVPANRGKKMAPEVREKLKHNFFKKGSEPKNTKKIGEISLRKSSGGSRLIYAWIKVDKHRWKLYHHYLWEKHNGPIPKGKIVRFKDGNSLNYKDISNLELISRKKNMLNNTIHNYPEELKKTIQLNRKLINKIKKYEKHSRTQ